MAVLLLMNSSSLIAQNSPFGSIPCQEPWNHYSVTYIPRSGLCYDRNGAIYLRGKTFYEVVGENILRPLIDGISSVTSKFFSISGYLESLSYSEELSSRDLFPSQMALFSCLNSHSLTSQFTGLNQVFASHFGGKSLAMHLRLTLLTIADLKKQYPLNDGFWKNAQLVYSHTLKDCSKNSPKALP